MSKLFENTAQNRRIGIALVCLTTLMFASLDASAKWLVKTVPVFQVVFMRFAVQAMLGAIILVPRRATLRLSNPRLQLIRGVILGTMTLMNFTALQYLQLAETGAMQFSVPILIAVLSAWLLNEHFDMRRWIAIAMGFVGVLFVMRPGTSAFHPAIFLSMMNAMLYAIFNIMTRHLASSEDPLYTQVISGTVASLMLAPLAAWYWQTPDDWQTWALFLVMGLCGGTGHWVSAIAHRYASAAVLGPFLYQQIIYMVLVGWLLFGQVPDVSVLLGGSIVVLSGLYLLWRELGHSPAAS